MKCHVAKGTIKSHGSKECELVKYMVKGGVYLLEVLDSRVYFSRNVEHLDIIYIFKN